jgi:hypothetical protein
VGLDMVELVLAIEEEFDILISDALLEKAKTPKDLADIIYSIYQSKDKDRCSSQVGFYKLRRIVQEHFRYSKDKLKPTTKLQDIFQNDIKKNWKKFNKLLETYQRLELDKNGKIVLSLSTLVVIVMLCSYVNNIADMIVCIVSIPLWYAFGYILLYPFFATVIPSQYATLADWVRFVGGSKVIKRYPTYQSILDKVIHISIIELNLSKDQINPYSRYVEDLGAC